MIFETSSVKLFCQNGINPYLQPLTNQLINQSTIFEVDRLGNIFHDFGQIVTLITHLCNIIYPTSDVEISNSFFRHDKNPILMQIPVLNIFSLISIILALFLL